MSSGVVVGTAANTDGKTKHKDENNTQRREQDTREFDKAKIQTN